MSLNLRSNKRKPFRKLPLSEIKKKLTPLQFRVTQLGEREPAFENEFWNNRRHGLYVDILSGEPLFSTKDQIDNGMGWPTFKRPLNPDYVLLLPAEDQNRVKVRSKIAESHLGELEEDSRWPGCQIYSVNSAALRFVQVRDLMEEGYAVYLSLFQER